MLWMVLEAGFTAPAVMPQRLSLSRLAVKWSAGPPGRGDSQDITVKGFVVTRCYWLNYISPLWLRSAAFSSRLHGAGFSLCLCIILGLPLFLCFSHLLILCLAFHTVTHSYILQFCLTHLEVFFPLSDPHLLETACLMYFEYRYGYRYIFLFSCHWIVSRIVILSMSNSISNQIRFPTSPKVLLLT